MYKSHQTWSHLVEFVQITLNLVMFGLTNLVSPSGVDELSDALKQSSAAARSKQILDWQQKMEALRIKVNSNHTRPGYIFLKLVTFF